MRDKTVSTYPSTIKFVPECFKTQEMCNKAVNRCFFVFNSIPDQQKTQKICDRVVSEDPFLKMYVPDQYKTQQMCDEAVDDFLAPWKFVPNWFVASKMIKILFTALYADENILYFNEGFGNVVFICNEMDILNMDPIFLTLTLMILILMKIILMPLFSSDFWLGILSWKKGKHLKST